MMWQTATADSCVFHSGRMGCVRIFRGSGKKFKKCCLGKL
jgi:uncharacterized protein YchJ